MPISINRLLAQTTEEELELVYAIMKNGQLKAGKPTLEKESIGLRKIPLENSGRVAYLWAAVAYHLSENKKHAACPPDARFLLRDPADKAWLDQLCNKIVDTVPEQQRYGQMARKGN